jgi:hypothetical protein
MFEQANFKFILTLSMFFKVRLYAANPIRDEL